MLEAIEDVVQHNAWRPNAKRAILFLGDEGMEGGDSVDADDIAAADKAIGVAKGGDVEVLATVGPGPAEGRIVAVRQGNLLATSFHPEITGDTRVHRLFVEMVRSI